MAQNITLLGASYPDVPAVDLPKTGGGLARFTDVTDTTATAADVAAGKRFYLADGTPATGSAEWSWLGSPVERLWHSNAIPVTLTETDYATWVPSTTAKAITASANITYGAIDMAHYEYFLHWRFRADVAYAEGTTMKATPVTECQDLWQAIFRRPSNLANQQTGTFNGNSTVTLYTAPLLVYNNTSGTLTQTYSTTYGFYIAATAATFSSATAATPTLTIKTPTVNARCNSSYFATARAADVDQAASSYTLYGELLQVPQGGVARSIYGNLSDIFLNGV